MTQEPMMPAEAAAVFVAWLERRGAIFSLKPDGSDRAVALDGADVRDHAEADRLAMTGPGICATKFAPLLRAARTTH